MNHHEPLPTLDCDRVASLLPLLDTLCGPDADAATSQASRLAFAREHAATCAYCQARRVQYARIDRALRTHYGLGSVARRPTEEIMQHITDRATQQQTTIRRLPPHLPPSGRSWLPGVAAVVSVLLLIGLSILLFNGRLGFGPGANLGPPRYSFAGTQGLFAGVSMVSPTEGWALGQITKAADGTHPLSEVTFYHYQNGTWTPVRVKTSRDFAEGGVSGFNGTISMDSPTDGWAVAHNFNRFSVLLHYANGAWSEAPAGDLWKVQALSPTSVWGISGLQDGRDSGLVHYDGTSWTTQTIAGVSGGAARVVDLQMRSETEGWALVLVDQNAATYALARYSGGAWTVESTFGAGDAAFVTTLAMVSPTEGWALGQKIVADSHGVTAHVPLQQLVYHYANGKWTAVALPADSGSFTTLTRIVMRSPTEGWIVGSVQRTYPGSTASNYQQHTVLYQYAGGQWRRVAAPSTGTTVDAVTDLAFTADGAGWACGYVSAIPATDSVQDSNILERASPELFTYQGGAWSVYQQ
jgi:hypothetical protein